MKKLILIISLFFALTAHAEVLSWAHHFFIDKDGLIKQMLEVPNGKPVAKIFTGKVQSKNYQSVWVVVDGVKTEEYPVFRGKDFEETPFLYQRPDGRIYTLGQQDIPFTGAVTLSRKINGDKAFCIYQNYKNGLPNGPKYQGIEREPHLVAKKPIIYLYPQESTEVNVKVGYPEKFTHTYPKYTNGWHVLAQPNGDLTDLQTGRHLYALYWEGLNASQNTAPDGFIVKGSDTITFLEEKLAMLGLTEREANEFIIYWLPKLENNPYNLIRFQSLAQQNKNMPLNITPAPNTLIRVMMEYKPLNEKVELPEQILPSTPARTGFTVVEWGGTELNKE